MQPPILSLPQLAPIIRESIRLRLGPIKILNQSKFMSRLLINYMFNPKPTLTKFLKPFRLTNKKKIMPHPKLIILFKLHMTKLKS